VIELFAQESCPVFSKIRFLCFTFGKFCQFNDSVEVNTGHVCFYGDMFSKKKKKEKRASKWEKTETLITHNGKEKEGNAST
jgi:hypothetical protein